MAERDPLPAATKSDVKTPEKTVSNPAPMSTAIRAKASPWRFMTYVGSRFNADLCQQRAAQLTFTSLIALVPLLAVSFAIFAAFPAYSRLKEEVQSFIFDNFIPQVGTSLKGHLDTFTQQTGQLTAVGILFLIFSAVMLMVSVSNTMNVIWRAPKRRNVVAQMLVFWAMITLAPLVFGASLSLSSYLFTQARLVGVDDTSVSNLALIAPFAMQTIGFALLFLIMPNAKVHRTDAIIGGLFASGLFELLKKGFGLYITTFPTYQTIYGALATIPIFLVWVYLSWIVVLLAAQVTAALPEWRAGARRWRKGDMAPFERLIVALASLAALRQAQVEGGGLTERRLLRAAAVDPAALGSVQDELEKNRYITRGDRQEWLLSRDLAHVTLYDLYGHLGLSVDAPLPGRHLSKAWARRFHTMRGSLSEILQDKMSMTLDELLSPSKPGEFASNEVDDRFEKIEEEELDRERNQMRARIAALLGLGTITGAS